MSRPTLLGVDIDGTLSPIANEPRKAVLAPGASAALALINTLPDLRLVLFTGRGAEDARRQFGLDAGISIVGDHGAEILQGAALDPGIVAEVIEGCLVHPDVRIENKQFSIAVHYRMAKQSVAQRVAEFLTDLARSHGLHLLHGKSVIELAATHLSKGQAVARVAKRANINSIIYFGDDVTDETVFGLLGSGDLSVKVGPGGSLAAYQLGDVGDVVEFLRATYRALSYH